MLATMFPPFLLVDEIVIFAALPTNGFAISWTDRALNSTLPARKHSAAMVRVH